MRRLGDPAEVAGLRAEIVNLLAHPQSVIVNGGLYSAFHSGHTLGAEGFAKLHRELAVLASKDQGRLTPSISSLGEL